MLYLVLCSIRRPSEPFHAGRLFMWKEPKCLTTWVDLCSRQNPGHILLAGLGGAFTPKTHFEVPTKLHLLMLKGPSLITVAYRTLVFPEYGMANTSNFTRGFTPATNPEWGNNIWAAKWAFIYVIRAKAKNSVISCIRVLRVRNGQCQQFHARLYPCQQPRKG